jgi:hypothetical protein
MEHQLATQTNKLTFLYSCSMGARVFLFFPPIYDVAELAIVYNTV